MWNKKEKTTAYSSRSTAADIHIIADCLKILAALGLSSRNKELTAHENAIIVDTQNESWADGIHPPPPRWKGSKRTHAAATEDTNIIRKLESLSLELAQLGAGNFTKLRAIEYCPKDNEICTNFTILLWLSVIQISSFLLKGFRLAHNTKVQSWKLGTTMKTPITEVDV